MLKVRFSGRRGELDGSTIGESTSSSIWESASFTIKELSLKWDEMADHCKCMIFIKDLYAELCTRDCECITKCEFWGSTIGGLEENKKDKSKKRDEVSIKDGHSTFIVLDTMNVPSLEE